MPWIKRELCDGCTACVGSCPATAISIRQDLKAWIHDDKCTHCGTCQEACAHEAVRPDSERLPMDVKTNIHRVKSVMRRAESPAVRQRSLNCAIDHYETQRRLAETTLKELAAMYGRNAAPSKSSGKR